MYKHILIPTDGSETAAKGIDAGIEFARQSNAKVTLFTAVPEYQVPSESEIIGRHVVSLGEHTRMAREKAHDILDPAAQRMRAAGLDVDTGYAESDRPYQAIIDAAKKRGCDLILMSSHGRHGLADLWFGSETREVLSHSQIPTLVYR